MPLVEETIVRDADKVVRTTERKLYTLAELKTLDETGSDEIDSDAYEKALDKMREWVDNDSWWTESVLDNDAVELFKACGITVPQKTEVVHVKVDGKLLRAPARHWSNATARPAATRKSVERWAVRPVGTSVTFTHSA